VVMRSATSEMLVARASTGALTKASKCVIIARALYMNGTTWSTVDVYSIDTKITNLDGSHRLEKRTPTPMSLTGALAVCKQLEREHHVVELRRAS